MLIWGGLIVLLLSVLIVGAIWLLRKGRAALAELERLEALNEAAREAIDAHALPKPSPNKASVLRPFSEVRDEYRLVMAERSERNDGRREQRLQRAKSLVATDPTRYKFLIEAKTKEDPCP